MVDDFLLVGPRLLLIYQLLVLGLALIVAENIECKLIITHARIPHCD